MLSNCPRCHSKYVAFSGKEETFEKTIETYCCQSCKKTFTVEKLRELPEGEWLMTLYGDARRHYGCDDDSFYYGKIIKIYKKDNSFSILQMTHGDKYEKKVVKPKIQVSKTLDTYNLWVDTFGYSGNANAETFIVNKIEFNAELKKEAMKDDAMRALHKKGEFIVNGFKEDILLKDVKRWLDKVLCVPASTQKSGGCYVATCVYGSYDCPQVWTLRRFRDYTLEETWYGRTFIRIYYAISPTFVKWFGKKQWFQNLWKPTLDFVVEKLNGNGVEDTPYDDRKW